MQFRETINNRTGAVRYYVNGRRVTRGVFETFKAICVRLDTFAAWTRGDLSRMTCHGTRVGA